ncbi:MAG: PAS domain S-box protein [Burkholderiales bacterium]
MNDHRKLLVVLGAGLLAVVALLGYLIWSGYRTAIQAAETTTRSYASILEARFDATLRRADAELQKLVRTMPVAALSRGAASRYDHVNNGLKASLVQFPELAALGVFDIGGDMIYTSRDSLLRLNIFDRGYFRALRDNPGLDIVFSEAIDSHATGRPGISVARAVRDEQGVFRGVVVASISLDRFQTLFQSLDVGANGIVALYRLDDFTQVMRQPEIKGRRNMALPPDTPARTLLTGGARTASYRLTAATDGITRIYSAHALDSFPFFVSVGVARDDALAVWRTRSLMAGLFMLLLVALLFGLLRRLWRADADHAGLVALVNASNDAIVSRDSSGKVLSWNRGAERLFGYSAGEMMGRDISVLAPPALRHELRIGQENAQNFQARSHESIRLAKDGRQIAVSISAAPIRRKAGDDAHAVALIYHDITTRKQAEAERARLAAVAEGSSDAIFIRDVEDRIVYWNNSAHHLYGYTSDEVMGGNSDFLVPPELMAQRASNRVTLETGGIVSNHETERLHKDGTRRDVSVSVSVVMDANGETIGLATIARDIGERKRAEVAIRKAAQRLDIALEGSRISVWEADLRIGVVWLDSNWATLRGYTNTETTTTTTTAELLTLAHPEDRQRIVAAAVQSMKDEVSAYVVDHRVKSATGEWLWIQSRGRVVERDVGGRALRIIGTNTDITERQQAETARASLEAQLRESQKMQAIGTLAGGIAHDFNNIIAIILGNVDLARQDVSHIPHAVVCMERIQLASARARDLVRQILAFSRRQATARKPINLIPVVEETVRLLRATLPARLSLDVQCDDAMPLVLADATQIQQILINLVTNAMQAMPAGSGRIRIRLDNVMLDTVLAETQPSLRALYARRPGRTCRLAVSDSGPGVDAVKRERIFEPFFTTKAVGEGTGLGLSVVHGIAQEHEGAIVVDSEPGKGATFTLYLPLNESLVVSEAGATALAGNAPIPGEGVHVLYIDDDADMVFMVKRLLERRGYRVSAYADAHEALVALRAAPATFDLVLSDYNMPGMSGLEVAREVRGIRAELPVAIASGFVDEILQARAAAAGVRELIFKADTVDAFCDAVQRLARTVSPKIKNA